MSVNRTEISVAELLKDAARGDQMLERVLHPVAGVDHPESDRRYLLHDLFDLIFKPVIGRRRDQLI